MSKQIDITVRIELTCIKYCESVPEHWSSYNTL